MASSYDFAALDALLDQRLTEAFGYQPEERALPRAAAMAIAFNEKELIRHVGAQGGTVSERDLNWLRENARAVPDGLWTLSPSSRRDLLVRLDKSEGLNKVFDQYGPKASKEGQALFFRLLITGQAADIDPEELTLEEARQLLVVMDWLDGTTPGKTYADLRQQCQEMLEKVELLHQMIRHTEHFSGRVKELEQLKAFVFNGTGQIDPLLIFGIGGIGKSTLVSKFILDYGIFTGEEKIPFVYMDFDRAGMSIAEPVHLAIEALRQLMLQFPGDKDQFDPLSSAHADFIEFAARGGENDNLRKVSQKESRGFILRNMASRYLAGVQLSSPILVVLDSFEEAQLRASEGELHNLLEFLNEIRSYVPSLRLMIVGRSDLVTAPFAMQELEVGDFDAAAAEAYLATAGVPSADLRSLIFSRVGGNPLNLKLAAALVAAGQAEGEDFLRQLDENRIQEQLVRRNLAHIPDPEARKLAEPGLLLRRITPEVIREVMAGPCGLGVLTEWKSEELFQSLRRVTFLVEERGGVIQFRRDIRMALREAVWARSQVQAKSLMTAAIAYYAPRPDAESQAEYLYHRLLSEDPNEIAKTDPPWAELRPYLENAIGELPPDAAALLGIKFNLRVDKAVTEGQSDTAWETSAAAQVARSMQEGTTIGVLTSLWDQMAKHTTSNSYFNSQRALLAIRLGHFDAAEKWLPELRQQSIYAAFYHALLLENYQEGSEHFDELVALIPNIDPASIPFSSWSTFVETSCLLAKLAGLKGQEILPIAERFLAATAPSLESILLTNGILSSESKQREEPPQYEAIRSTKGYLVWEPILQFRALRRMELSTIHKEFKAGYLKAMSEIARAYQKEEVCYRRLLHQVANVDVESFSQTLFNAYNVVVSDVSWPSEWEVGKVDVLDFLLAYHRGDLAAAEQNFFPIGGGELPGEDNKAPSTSPAPADAPEKIKEIRRLIAEDRTEEAIKAMEELSTGNRELTTTIILTASRFNRMRNDKINGTLSYGDESLQHNQIRMALLQILNDMEK